MNGSPGKYAKGQSLGKPQSTRGTQGAGSDSGKTQSVRNQDTTNRPIGSMQRLDSTQNVGLQQQRQAMPAGRHHEETNFNPFINAPISLTNLVQLSGISLTPVSSSGSSQQQQQQTRRQQQSISNGPNNSQVITFDNLQRPKITVSLNSRQQQQQFKQNTQTYSDPISNHHGRIYNLEAIPSLQLLNQHDLVASSSSGGGGSSSIANLASIRNRQPELRTPPKAQAISSTSKKSRSQAKPIGVYLPSSSNNRVQILPVLANGNTGLDFNSNNVRELQSYDISNLASKMSRSDSPSSANQSTSGASDGDSMSLMKLMAILNNPALTITPVDAANQPAMPSMQRYNTDQGDGPQASDESNLRTSDQRSHKKNSKHRNRLPKSAANLQLLNGNAMSSVSDDAPFQSVGEAANGFMDSTTTSSQQSLRLANISHKQYAGMNWLSDLSAPIVENDSGMATLSWSKIDQPIEENACMDNTDLDVNSSCMMDVDKDQPVGCYGSNVEYNSTERSIFESECIVEVPKIQLGHLNLIARYQHTTHKVYSTSPIAKAKGQPMRTTKQRLYLPAKEEFQVSEQQQWNDDANQSLPGIEIEEEQIEKILGEHHQILEKLDEIAESVASRRPLVSDPDDIFVNKSKRVMSKIDSEIERMKKRRFDMISRGLSPRTPGQEYDSDDDSLQDDNSIANNQPFNMVAATVIPIQLPLDEEMTKAKRGHFSAVGLVSRDDRNKIELKQYEERFKEFSMGSATAEIDEVPDDIKRFVDAVIKTGGVNIELRTDTDIKRNELPFIEGLTRNTSRTKLNFMSSLGLDKRSKRTTLYKVKPQEVVINNQTLTKPQIDLNLKSKPPGEGYVKPPLSQTVPVLAINEPIKQITNCHLNGNADLWRAIKLAQASCREAIMIPNKADYMKSLGLLAS